VFPAAGDVVAVEGVNGSGKSTLLAAAAASRLR
jgi:ABC-type cobalamin/Fe3+-siderophores transport system ATPase subunit